MKAIYSTMLSNLIFHTHTHTRVPRRARVESALAIYLCISLSKDNLLLVVDPKYMNSSTTSIARSTTIVDSDLGDVVACARKFVF